MNLKIAAQLKTRFPDLTVLICNVKGVTVEKQSFELEKFKDERISQPSEPTEIFSGRRKIKETVKRIPQFSFTVLDFIEVFKALYSEDWK